MAEQEPNDGNQPPKIVVDEDWKSEAASEKERLAQQEQQGGPAGDQEPIDEGEDRPMPPASFATLVSGLVTQILFALGAIEDPASGQRYRNLPMAKHHIDTLAVLEEKTKGNLNAEESQLLDGALYEVRIHYVRAAQEG
jgi:hypothetical protein